MTSGADGNGIYNISDGNKAFRFVNPVSADGFTARFSGLAAHGSQTSTDVVLTDLLDPSVSVRFRFAASDKKPSCASAAPVRKSALTEVSAKLTST